jgi:hypothetical protein
VKGPVPELAVHVSCPAPVPQKGPFAVKLPWGIAAAVKVIGVDTADSQAPAILNITVYVYGPPRG